MRGISIRHLGACVNQFREVEDDRTDTGAGAGAGTDIFALFSSINSIFECFEDAFIKDSNKSLTLSAESMSVSQESTSVSQESILPITSDDGDSISLSYFNDLRRLHHHHSQTISEWESQGCPIYEGISAARTISWDGTSKTLKMLRYATKLCNEAFPVAEVNADADPTQAVHMNVFRNLIALSSHKKSNCTNHVENTNTNNGIINNNNNNKVGDTAAQEIPLIKPDIISLPPLISLSHLQAIWIATLVMKANRGHKSKNDSLEEKVEEVCLFSSLDCVWLGYKLSTATAGEDKDRWIELTIDNNGQEFILNPIMSKFDDLTNLIEFQNNIFTNSAIVNSNTAASGAVRPPPLTSKFFTSIHLPQLVILTCLLPLAKGLYPAASPIRELSAELFTVHQSIECITSVDFDPNLLSSLSSLLDAKFEHIFDSFRDRDRDQGAKDESFNESNKGSVDIAIKHYQVSNSIQPMNYVCSFELGRVLYMNSLMHSGESVIVFDKLATQLKYLEDLALEIDEAASLPVLAQVISLKVINRIDMMYYNII